MIRLNVYDDGYPSPKLLGTLPANVDHTGHLYEGYQVALWPALDLPPPRTLSENTMPTMLMWRAPVSRFYIHDPRQRDPIAIWAIRFDALIPLGQKLAILKRTRGYEPA